MNDLDRIRQRAALEAAYRQAMTSARLDSRDGLAQYLIAADAKYRLAELATSIDEQKSHRDAAVALEYLVAERKKVLSAASTLTEEPAEGAASASRGSAPVKEKKGNDELRGFDPESCRVTEIPEATFDSICGNHETIAALKKSFRHNEEIFKFKRLITLAPLATRPDHHLMYGPPGTGKSFLCKAIAHEVMTQYPNTEQNPFNSAFFDVNSSAICSPFYAVAEKRLEALFAAAEKYQHCVICIDEMERLCPDRNATGTELNAVADAVAIVTRMLQLIDGVSGKCNAIIIACTNYPWKVDKAMRDRLSSKLLLDLPNLQAKHDYLLRNIGPFVGRTEAERAAAIEQLLPRLKHASFRDLETLAQTIQSTGLRYTTENHPGEYELTSFDPLPAEALHASMDNVVIAYDSDYHSRLKTPAHWGNNGAQQANRLSVPGLDPALLTALAGILSNVSSGQT